MNSSLSPSPESPEPPAPISATRRRRIWLIAAPLLVLGALIAVSFAHPSTANSAPYVPKADSEVLETLPGPTLNDWQTSATPNVSNATPPVEQDPASAAMRARAELTLYQRSADPRYLGRAEAALGSFWDEPLPPEPILVLRARIRQSNHEFLSALRDLDQALGSAPDDGQALLDRASIETVLGRYEAALRDCHALEPLTAPLYSTVCRAAIAGVTGSAGPAYTELSQAIAGPGVETEDGCWADSLLGELATRLGRDAEAEAHFRAVLKACPSDTYARGALGDLLIDLERYPEAVNLLRDQTRQDALLLRLAIAEKHSHAPDFDAHLKDLTQRFEEARLRGNQVHRREEARFELALNDAPEPALALAIANFEVQREPADVRIALESALAAKRPEGVRNVVAFVNASRLEDPRIKTLLNELGR